MEVELEEQSVCVAPSKCIDINIAFYGTPYWFVI
jgi:hypothetical protein